MLRLVLGGPSLTINTYDKRQLHHAPCLLEGLIGFAAICHYVWVVIVMDCFVVC